MDVRVDAVPPREMQFMERVAAKLRAERKARGMTLSQVAEKVGTSPQTVQRIETARMTVSTEWVQRICAALELDPETLLNKGPEIDRGLVIDALTKVNVLSDDLARLKQSLESLLKGSR